MSIVQLAKNAARRNPRFMQFYRGLDISSCKGTFRFDPVEMQSVIAQNRSLLSEFGDWIDSEAMNNSVYQYGLSPQWADAMQRPVGESMTYTDMLCYVATKLSRQIDYFEIGVSVGKNFWQVLNRISNAHLTGLDIEDMNPPLKRQLKHVSTEPVASNFSSERKSGPSVERLQFAERGNDITYCAGDVFDPAVWNRLKGNKFNLIFSDACHTAPALRFEWSRLTELELLDSNGFTMIWDDLVSKEIRHTFNAIAEDCISRFGLTARNCCLMHVSGWVGDFEPEHPIGVISSQGFVT